METKVDSKVFERSFEVKEDGSVLIKIKEEKEINVPYREFLTTARELEKAKTDITTQLSEDYQKNLKENLEKVEKDIKEMEPYVKLAEEKAREEYDRQMTESKIKTIQAELKKPLSEQNKDYLMAIWKNIQEKEKDTILAAITQDEKDRIAKMLFQTKQEERK